MSELHNILTSAGVPEHEVIAGFDVNDIGTYDKTKYISNLDDCSDKIKDLFRQTVIDALNDAPSRDEVIETLRKKIGEL